MTTSILHVVRDHLGVETQHRWSELAVRRALVAMKSED